MARLWADETRRARMGAAVVFFLPGLVTASWSARLPAVKRAVHTGDAGLGVAFMCLNVGAIIGLQFGSVLVGRIGSRLALRACLPVFCLALILPGLARSLAALAVSLLVLAAFNGIVDVAMNAQGVAVEERRGRPVLSGLHAMHSLGGITGAGLGALAAELNLGHTGQFVVVGACGAAMAVAVGGVLLARADDERVVRPHRPTVWKWLSGWTPALLVIGGLAFCLTLAEGSALNWASVFLRDARSAAPSVAAAGVTAFMAAMAAGRMFGDRLRRWWGPVALFRTGALLAGAGIGIAVAFPVALAGVIGFAVLGAGLANLLPVAVSAASRRSANTAGAVARVSAVAYLGSFAGPGLIGSIAATSGLSTALIVPAALVSATAIGASAVSTANRGR